MFCPQVLLNASIVDVGYDPKLIHKQILSAPVV